MTPRRQTLIALTSVLVAAFALRMITWHQLRNMVWPDEIFNALEQSHRAVFGYGVMPWEWRIGLRSWLLPGFLAGVMAVAWALTGSVVAYLAACAGVLSAISLVPIWTTFRSALDQFGLRAATVAGVILVVWFELVYFAPKALTEIVGGNCLVAGVLLADQCVRAAKAGATLRARRVALAASLLTLAVAFRIQFSISAFIAFLYLLRGVSASLRWRALIAATVVALCVGMLDALTWDYPFSSYVVNIRVQILEAKSENYGVSPWYAYFEVYARVWGLWGLVILALAALGARLRPILAICALAILATHVPIAHKEYRFLYPAMLMVIVLAALGCARIVRWLEDTKPARVAWLATAALVTAWLGASLRLSNAFHESKTMLAMSFTAPDWHWKLHRGGLLAMQELHDDPTVCGIGFIGTFVYVTGGYTYLHRDIPIYQAYRREDIGGFIPNVNVYVLAYKPELEQVNEFRGYQRQKCISDVCIYRRPGGCKDRPGYHFNDVLKARGE